MKIVIPSIQTPFIQGGAQLMTNGLKDALIRAGHEAETVTMPFKFAPESYIEESMDIWVKQDFNEFTGHSIDKVIVLQFPSYYTNHDDKVLWLMHQHRAVYELYESENTTKTLDSLKNKIHKMDTDILAAFPKRYCMSKTVARRLKKYNGIEAIPLYHPPYQAENYYCEEPYNYVFFPSRLETLKRQDLLIEAMRYTKTDIKAIIAGDGGQKERYEQMIETYGLHNKVRLTGEISEEQKRILYARSLAVFFAPFEEDYGYVTLEAMLSSKAVITCKDSGGPLEFVIDSENGFICESNPEEIAEKLDFFYTNKHQAKRMGKNGLQHYKEQNISWDNVVETLLR